MATWGSLKKDASIPEARYGKGQGYFRYYRPDGRYDTVVAVGGRLLLNGGDLVIEGLPDGFQKERMIEAIQWKDILFIATGTKLVEFNGSVAKVVSEYKPLPLEYLYVGSNGLASFPDNFMSDGVYDNLRVDGVVPNIRKGITNQPVMFTAFISKPGTEEIQYKWEYKMLGRDSFVLGKDWSTDKTWTLTPKEIGDYVIQVSARGPLPVSGPVPDPEIGQIPVYKVFPFDENISIDTSQMHTCNRIMLHWERIIVYGEQKNKSRIYISHLDNPRYFPTNLSIDFENNEQEPLQKIVQYRNFLVAFMPSSIQALYGNSPIGDDPFRRVVIHTGLGCIAPETPKVMGNYIIFLSNQGVHILKSIGVVDEKMNVQKVDQEIENQIPLDKEACAVVFENQYHLCFPKDFRRFRFYHERGIWVKDESPSLDFSRMFEWDNELVGQSQTTGRTVMFDENVYTDLGYIYEDRLVSKSYDFGEPHNPKKVKELQLILGRANTDVNLSVSVSVDDNAIVDTTTSHAEIIDNSVRWIEEQETNVTIDAGTVFGQWVLGRSSFDNAKQKKVIIPMSGKGYVTSVDIRHEEAGPSAILSIGFIFKTKKP